MVNCLVYKRWKKLKLTRHIVMRNKYEKRLWILPRNAFKIWPESSYHITNLKQVVSCMYALCAMCIIYSIVCLSVSMCRYITTLSLWKWNLHIQTLTLFFFRDDKKQNKWCRSLEKKTMGKKHTNQDKNWQGMWQKNYAHFCTRRVKYSMHIYLLELELVLPHICYAVFWIGLCSNVFVSVSHFWKYRECTIINDIKTELNWMSVCLLNKSTWFKFIILMWMCACVSEFALLR